jgi:hypothetical protein
VFSSGGIAFLIYRQSLVCSLILLADTIASDNRSKWVSAFITSASTVGLSSGVRIYQRVPGLRCMERDNFRTFQMAF